MASPKKLIQSTKRLTLNTSAVNRYGFRMLTEGAELEAFKKNPIMLFMHERAGAKWQSNPTLPIGIWLDIKVEGDAITAIPAFDENDEFAMTIYHKVENDILRMASIGASPIEESVDPEHLLPGQKYATITKWEAMEASIVDIGANRDCLTLYTENEGRVLLSSSNIETYLPKILNTDTMIKLSAPVIIALALGETHTEAQINEAIIKLNADYQNAKTEKENALASVVTLKAEKEALELKLSAQKVDTLVSTAIAEKKITEAQKESYLKLATADFETTQTLLKDMKAHVSIGAQLSAGQAVAATNEEAELIKLSFDELDKSGKLARLKALNNDAFEAKYKEKYPNAK